MYFALIAALLADSRLADIQPAPDFTLTTQDEKEVRFSSLNGKVRLVSFVFTTCSGSCPPTTARLVQVQQKLVERKLLKDKVHFVTVSLDPARDTPAKLLQYAKLYDADLASWTFLTGPPATVEKTITAWGMWTKPAANGQLDHPSRVFLVDRKGRIREIYDLAYLKPAWVVEDIASLLAER